MQQVFDTLLNRTLDAERRVAALGTMPAEIAATASILNVNAENLLDVANALAGLTNNTVFLELIHRLQRGLDSQYFLSARLHEMAMDINPMVPAGPINSDSSSPATSFTTTDSQDDLVHAVSTNAAGEESKAAQPSNAVATMRYVREVFKNASPEHRAEILMQILEDGGVTLNDDGELVRMHDEDEIWIRRITFPFGMSEGNIDSFVDDVDYYGRYAGNNDANWDGFQAFWEFAVSSIEWTKHEDRGQMCIEVEIPSKAKGSIEEWRELVKLNLETPISREIRISCPSLEGEQE